MGIRGEFTSKRTYNGKEARAVSCAFDLVGVQLRNGRINEGALRHASSSSSVRLVVILERESVRRELGAAALVAVPRSVLRRHELLNGLAHDTRLLLRARVGTHAGEPCRSLAAVALNLSLRKEVDLTTRRGLGVLAARRVDDGVDRLGGHLLHQVGSALHLECRLEFGFVLVPNLRKLRFGHTDADARLGLDSFNRRAKDVVVAVAVGIDAGRVLRLGVSDEAHRAECLGVRVVARLHLVDGLINQLVAG